MAASFDWVSARAACSQVQVFEKLRLQVEADVKSRNAIRKQGDNKFDTARSGDNFTVFVEGDQPSHSVTFTMFSSNEINVKNDCDEILLRGVVTLADNGECKLRVEDEELEFWQFRKRALEALFFFLV